MEKTTLPYLLLLASKTFFLFTIRDFTASVCILVETGVKILT